MNLKSGYKSSEFFLSLSVTILLISFGVFISIYKDNIYSHISTMICFILAFLKSHSYLISRIALKISQNPTIISWENKLFCHKITTTNSQPTTKPIEMIIDHQNVKPIAEPKKPRRSLIIKTRGSSIEMEKINV